MTNTTQGFTLIELLIVIAIIGILAAVLIPNLLGAQKRGYDAGAISCGKSIQNAMAMAYVDAQTYSTTPNVTGGVAAPAIALNMDGAAAACSAATMSLEGTPTQTASTYTFIVKDTRGANKYTFTPTSMTTAAQTAASTTSGN